MSAFDPKQTLKRRAGSHRSCSKKRNQIFSADWCRRPAKIGPLRDRMRARIGEISGVAISRVAVKATTSERLGFTGREEGIAATASATIRLPWDSKGWSD